MACEAVVRDHTVNLPADRTEPRLTCPNCGSDEIYEVSRWLTYNRQQTVDPDTNTVVFTLHDEGVWEHEKLLCLS